MFLRFRITNHASIRDEQELSLIALDRHDDLATADVPGTGQQALPVVAMYGANASGKSNVINALAFMRHVVVESHQRWLPDDPIPRRPFRLDEESRTKPSVFVADFATDGVRYEYGFGLTETAVQEEWLYAWPEHRRRVLFERAVDGVIKYGSSFPNRRDHSVGRPRSNSLLLSAAAANEHPLLLPLYRLFRSGLYPALNHTFDERLSLTMSELAGGRAAAALALVRFADLGVEEIRIKAPAAEHAAWVLSEIEQRTPPPDLSGDLAEGLAALRAALAKIGSTIVEDFAGLDPTSPPALSERLELAHRSRPDALSSATLSLKEESSGTRTWLGLVGPVLKALRNGTVLIVDELDAHLHPHLAARLIGLFQARDTNPHGAQLVFNTHDVSLMGRSTEYRLHRDQIYFAEKGDDGATRLYPLTDFARVRDDWDNLERWYLSSRLGAVPVFRDALLRELAEAVAG